MYTYHILFKQACVRPVEVVQLLVRVEAELLIICTHTIFSLDEPVFVRLKPYNSYCMDAELLIICTHIIFSLDEPVFVRLKPYNSYCVEKLWLGFSTGNRKEGSLDPHQIGLMKEVSLNSRIQSDFKTNDFNDS